MPFKSTTINRATTVYQSLSIRVAQLDILHADKLPTIMGFIVFQRRQAVGVVLIIAHHRSKEAALRFVLRTTIIDLPSFQIVVREEIIKKVEALHRLVR